MNNIQSNLAYSIWQQIKKEKNIIIDEMPYTYTHGFYVYELINSNNGMPFYVGKGRGERMYDHYENYKYDRNMTKGLRMMFNIIERQGGAIIYEIVNDEMSELEALALEAAVIDDIGIENLCNKVKGNYCNNPLSNGGSRELLWKDIKQEVNRKLNRKRIGLTNKDK